MMKPYTKILVLIILILSISTTWLFIKASPKDICHAQDCTQMGYTKTEQDCPDGFLRCMYDLSKVYCRNTAGVK